MTIPPNRSVSQLGLSVLLDLNFCLTCFLAAAVFNDKEVDIVFSTVTERLREQGFKESDIDTVLEPTKAGIKIAAKGWVKK